MVKCLHCQRDISVCKDCQCLADPAPPAAECEGSKDWKAEIESLPQRTRCLTHEVEVQNVLDKYDQQAARIAELEAENARLRAKCGATQ